MIEVSENAVIYTDGQHTVHLADDMEGKGNQMGMPARDQRLLSSFFVIFNEEPAQS